MVTAEGIRARNRAAIEAELLRVGREHLAHYGASGLSLRAVARDLGMASSAVYRYVDSRDELLTRLIVAAYTALADQVDAALADASPDVTPPERFRIVARTVRAWALAHPHEYALVYGSPVPGYHAPAERTTAPGTRVQARLLDILADLGDGRAATATDHQALSPLDDPMLAQAMIGPLRRGLTAWNLVLGTLSSELFEQLGPRTVKDPAAFFDAVIDDALVIVTAHAA